MKGTVVNTWIKTCKKVYDPEHVHAALKSVDFKEDVVFSPLVDVEDEKVFKFVEHMAGNTGKEVASVWNDIGVDNIQAFKNDYPAFLDRTMHFNF